MRLLRPGVSVHLIGIGGSGLSAIARVLHGWGYEVSGSDQQPSALTQALRAEGITVHSVHRAENLPGNHGSAPGEIVVVVSAAVPDDNPEVLAAKKRGLPVVKRSQLLGELTADKTTIAVAGTHGKTTTSAMIAWILVEAGLDPTFVVGGTLQNLGTNARAGAGPHFVIEADEYDRTFLGLGPHVAVVSALEHDHPDCYPTLEAMRTAFSEFLQKIRAGGLLVACGEDPEAWQLAQWVQGQGCRVQSYGLDDRWDWHAEGLHLGNHAAFSVIRHGRHLGTSALQIPGRHNVLNALAALAASVEVGVDPGLALAAVARFRGTARRFEVKGQAAGVTFVDDYAHHPTEIRATLAAARIKYPGRSLWAAFQPHTYTRTATLLEDFASAFGDADHVIVTSIFAAREKDTLGVGGEDIVALMAHPDSHYLDTQDEVVLFLLDQVQPGDVVLTLGAGDGYLVGERLLELLRKRDSDNAQQKLGAKAWANPSEQLAGGKIGMAAPENGNSTLRLLADRFRSTFGPAQVQEDRSLACHTSLRVGGPADLLVTANSGQALREAVTLAREQRIACRVLGSGTNVLVGDLGIRGLAVLNRARQVTFTGTTVQAESGAMLSAVAHLCVARGLGGLEWAVGIPGTIGGAVVGNAGAWGGDVASALVTASVLELDGQVVEWLMSRFQYGYRHSALKQEAPAGTQRPTVLAAEFALQPTDPQLLRARATEFASRRKASQPLGASCGSVFRNPPGDSAGRLIEAVGLKGQKSGAAEISPRHANFIVNHGGATAMDVKVLIDLARERVHQRFGLFLELEIELIGEWENSQIASGILQN